MVGRKPKPTALKELAGNPGHHPLNPSEPRPETEELECPSYLRSEAKKAWKRLAQELSRLGVLTALDRVALEVFCDAYQSYFVAARMVREQGELLPPPVKGQDKETLFGIEKGEFGPSEMVWNPWLAVKNKQALILHKFAVEFGLTPSSRARIHAGPAASDPTEDFLFGESLPTDDTGVKNLQ